MRIGVGSVDLSRVEAGPAVSGSAAQQAYDSAVKHLTEAQKKLTQDALGHAPEVTLKVDQALVDVAAMAVAAAAAALAREQNRSQNHGARPSATAAPERTPDDRRKGKVDVYA